MHYVPGASRDRALVFLHGLLGDSEQWHSLDRHIAPTEYADAYYVDFHFEQPRKAALTWDGVVDELLALLRHGPGLNSGLKLIGSSSGGHLALWLASRGLVAPENLVLFAPGGIPEVAKQRGMLQSFRTVDKIIDMSFERIFSNPALARSASSRQWVESYEKRLRPRRRDLVRNLIALSRHMRQSVLSNGDLRRIRAETLFVWGRNDQVTPPHLCELFLERVPGSRVAWIEAGHASHIEAPQETSRVLRDFCLRQGEYADHGEGVATAPLSESRLRSSHCPVEELTGAR